jgi:hypothetical protein
MRPACCVAWHGLLIIYTRNQIAFKQQNNAQALLATAYSTSPSCTAQCTVLNMIGKRKKQEQQHEQINQTTSTTTALSCPTH